MIRLLIFFLWIALFAAMLTLLLSVRASAPVEAFGWRMDAPLGLLGFCALVAAALVALATSALKDFAGAPKAARTRRAIVRREKGIAALMRGLEALAAGDEAAAKREAALAGKALGPAPAARLIAAQAALLSGDDAATGEALADMLDAPETEFLALRGLYARAMRAGDLASARGYAERAFERRDKARWAIDAVFELALARNDFAAARIALERAIKARTLEPATAERGLAAVLTASAYAANAAGDAVRAMEDVSAAAKRAPAFAPAAILASRLHARAGDARKAEKALIAAFALSPERALVEILDEITQGAAKEEKAAAFERLAAANPDSREALIAKARASLFLGDAAQASALAARLLRSSATQRALAIMADAQTALKGEAAGRSWLRRAAEAEEEAPSAGTFFRASADGWRRLIGAYMADAVVIAPPIAAPAPGIDEAELPATELPMTSPEPAFAGASSAAVDLALEEAAATGDEETAGELLDRDATAARSVS